MRILVTGGAGYIGSHATRELLDRGHQVTVLDNLSRGHRWAIDARADFALMSTGEAAKVLRLLQDRSIEAVLHFAADIEVGESVIDPAKYYLNNFANSISLLDGLRRTGVRKFVFSSTAAVYGSPEKMPIDENETCLPTNPYGRAKLMVERALEDFRSAYGVGYTVLRYFNVAGAHPDGGLGEDHHPETHLIPNVLKSARSGTPVKIFGTDYPTPDGTCIRDYIHVMDLVRAHILALESLKPGEGRTYNLGSERGFSVREVLAACEKVTGKKIQVEEAARRPGDAIALIASSRKIRAELGWQPQYPDLETIVTHAWRWHLTQPHEAGARSAGTALWRSPVMAERS